MEVLPLLEMWVVVVIVGNDTAFLRTSDRGHNNVRSSQQNIFPSQSSILTSVPLVSPLLHRVELSCERSSLSILSGSESLCSSMGCFVEKGMSALDSLPPHLHIPVVSRNRPNCFFQFSKFLSLISSNCDSMIHSFAASRVLPVVHSQ